MQCRRRAPSACNTTVAASGEPGSSSVTVGAVESTVTCTAAVVVALPAASVTTASTVCGPLAVEDADPTPVSRVQLRRLRPARRRRGTRHRPRPNRHRRQSRRASPSHRRRSPRQSARSAMPTVRCCRFSSSRHRLVTSCAVGRDRGDREAGPRATTCRGLRLRRARRRKRRPASRRRRLPAGLRSKVTCVVSAEAVVVSATCCVPPRLGCRASRWVDGCRRRSCGRRECRAVARDVLRGDGQRHRPVRGRGRVPGHGAG